MKNCKNCECEITDEQSENNNELCNDCIAELYKEFGGD